MPGKSFRKLVCVITRIYEISYFISNHRFWKKFPENPPSHDPKLQNPEKVWKKFPGYPLSHRPFFGNSFRDLPIWVK